jgi:nitrite reductase/ring-hydroxylating ferredoxin subunit
LVGGEDHVTGQADDASIRFARLERWTLERFPMVRQVRYRWSGQTIDTVDGIAYIGRNPMDKENIYIATGDCGMGMTHGTIAGMLLSDMILGIPNGWEALYDPARKWRHSMAEIARHNLNVAARFGDYVTPGDLADESEIPVNGGAVIRQGLRKIAVYKDESGICHHLSAVCSHLKCIVHWNTLEKTWDCPCHGSRYSAMGEVLNGPAISNLENLDQPAEVTPPHPASS